MMDYFPVFIHTRGRKIVFVGGTEDIGHKLILLILLTRGCRNMNALLAGFDAIGSACRKMSGSKTMPYA